MNKKAKVAYISAEYGIEGLPFLGGGLGTLAGDASKSFADLGLPVVGIGIYYHKGNFHQVLLEDGWQLEQYRNFDPTRIMEYQYVNLEVPIENRKVKVNAWRYDVTGETGHVVPIFFLDTNGNNDVQTNDDNICDILYPAGNQYHRLAQKQILGNGGVRLLDKLGFGDLDKYHINESHAALAGTALMEKYGSVEEVRKHLAYTTHTPVPAGIGKYPPDLVRLVLGNDFYSKHQIKNLTGSDDSDDLNMARLAMALSSEAFGVSQLHAQVSKYMFKDYPNMDRLYSIDNGVHVQTWASLEFQKLYDSSTNRQWRLHPKTLEGILRLSDEQVINAHEVSRARLGHFLETDTRVKGWQHYDNQKLTLGFARRFATYKQATLMFEQMDRLIRLGKDVQIVFSGKAHPSDNPGKEVIKEVFNYMKELAGEVSIWFIEDYHMDVAKYLVRGVDVWVNNPMRLLEASGTSGMKAAVNGVPQFSIPDGWFLPQEPLDGYSLPKGLIEGVTGWGIGRLPTEADFSMLLDGHESWLRRQEDRRRDAEDFYGKLEGIIIPLFKYDKPGWAEVMKSAIACNGSWYNTHRMVMQYFEKAYGIPIEELIV